MSYFYDKDTGINWGFIIFISILSFLPILIFKSCYDLEKFGNKERRRVKDFKGQYTFNIDSIASLYTLSNLKEKYKGKILILQIENSEKNIHPYSESILNDYSLNEISTVVLFKKNKIQEGTYSGSKTVGHRQDFKIYFVDPKTKFIYKEYNLEGASPPSEIKYRRGAPDEVFGNPPDLLGYLNSICVMTLSNKMK